MDHAICGVNASALAYGTGGSYDAQDQFYHSQSWNTVFNETRHLTYLYNNFSIYGTKVLISDEPHDPGQMFKASFRPMTSDHALWNNYPIPELKVNIKQFANEQCGKWVIKFDYYIA